MNKVSYPVAYNINNNPGKGQIIHNVFSNFSFSEGGIVIFLKKSKGYSNKYKNFSRMFISEKVFSSSSSSASLSGSVAKVAYFNNLFLATIVFIILAILILFNTLAPKVFNLVKGWFFLGASEYFSISYLAFNVSALSLSFYSNLSWIYTAKTIKK